MLWGAYQKFSKEIPKPIEVVEKANKFIAPEKVETLQKILYISGAKQTGYFWQLLGICELVFGILIIIPRTRLIGAIFLLPITLHIFLFHLFLEPEELPDLIMTAGLFFGNILVLLLEFGKIKDLVWIKNKS